MSRKPPPSDPSVEDGFFDTVYGHVTTEPFEAYAGKTAQLDAEGLTFEIADQQHRPG